MAKKTGLPQDELLWVMCNHVNDETAEEVGCHPTRLAMCKDCVIAGPENLGPMDFRTVCPGCLYEKLCRVPIVWGREYIDRDKDHHSHN